MLLFYIRHGDPIYNPDSLTPLGKRQAEAVAKRLAVHGIDKIYSSTSNRAYQTAVPLSEITKKEIVKVDFLNESHAWEYFAVPDENGKQEWIYRQSRTRIILAGEKAFNLGYKWYELPEFSEYRFKDGVDFFEKNTDEFMLSLGYEHDRINHCYKAAEENNDRVAIFAHEGMGCAFLSMVLDIPYSRFAAHYTMSHTGMTVIQFDSCGDNIVPRMLCFSNDSHIYKEGLPTSYRNRILI